MSEGLPGVITPASLGVMTQSRTIKVRITPAIEDASLTVRVA